MAVIKLQQLHFESLLSWFCWQLSIRLSLFVNELLLVFTYLLLFLARASKSPLLNSFGMKPNCFELVT